MTKHERLRAIVYQPEIYFTTGVRDPIRVCGSTTTMDLDDDDPAEWYHPDVGQRGAFWITRRGAQRVGIGFATMPTQDEYEQGITGPGVTQIIGARCRFCRFVVEE